MMTHFLDGETFSFLAVKLSERRLFPQFIGKSLAAIFRRQAGKGQNLSKIFHPPSPPSSRRYSISRVWEFFWDFLPQEFWLPLAFGCGFKIRSFVYFLLGQLSSFEHSTANFQEFPEFLRSIAESSSLGWPAGSFQVFSISSDIMNIYLALWGFP